MAIIDSFRKRRRAAGAWAGSSERDNTTTMPARTLFIAFSFLLVLLSPSFTSTPFHFAEASGFLRWARPYGGAINVTSSATGVCAVVAPSDINDGSHHVSVLNFSTGETIVRATVRLDEGGGEMEPIIIRPGETVDGRFTCSRLVGGNETSSSNISQNSLWCAVFLFSATSNAMPMLLHPNGRVLPMLSGASGAQLPWKCNSTHRCMFKTQEQQAKSLGGCFRRAEPWPYPPNNFPPLSSHVVLVDSDGAVFVFRPFEVATYGLSMLRRIDDSTVTSKLWLSPSLGWHASVQYVPITIPRTIFGPGRVPRFQTQNTMCLLALFKSDGSAIFFDADREDNSTATRLPFMGALASQGTQISMRNERQLTECFPFAQSVRRLVPALDSDFDPENPLNKRLYSSVLSINCRNGRGWLWNANITENDPATHKPSRPFNISFAKVGSFNTPPSFDKTLALIAPKDPLATDVDITTIQPVYTLRTANHHATETQQGRIMQLVTTIAALRHLPNTYSSDAASSPLPSQSPARRGSDDDDDESAPEPPPAVALMTFVSEMVLDAMDRTRNLPNFTSEQIGSVAISRVSIVAPGSSGGRRVGGEWHNITHSLGWVASPAGLPARYNASVFGASLNGETSRSIQRSAVRAVAEWFLGYGVAYSVFCSDVHVLLNATTGEPIVPSALVMNSNSTFAFPSHEFERGPQRRSLSAVTKVEDPTNPRVSFAIAGGVKAAAPVALHRWGRAMSITPILDWQDNKIKSNRSGLHNRGVLLTPSSRGSGEEDSTTPSGHQPSCLYTLKANDLAVMFYITAVLSHDWEEDVRRAIDRRVADGSPHMMSFPSNDADDGGIRFGKWEEHQGRPTLFNPYTQSYCSSPVSADDLVSATIVPAGNSIIVVQTYQGEVLEAEKGDSHTTPSNVSSPGLSYGVAPRSRLTMVPLRDLIDSTSQESFALGRNYSSSSSTIFSNRPPLRPQTLHSIGTPMVYVCGQHCVHAYNGPVGNASWLTDLRTIPGCANCRCNQDPSTFASGNGASSDSMMLSADRKFIVVIADDVISVKKKRNANGEEIEEEETSEVTIILHAETGKLLHFIGTGEVRRRSAECLSSGGGGGSAGIDFGDLKEVSLTAAGLSTRAAPYPSSGKKVVGARYAFIALIPLVGTRCFAQAVVTKPTGGNSGGGSVVFHADLYFFFFLGSSPSLSLDIQVSKGFAYLSTDPADSTRLWSGRYLYGIDLGVCTDSLRKSEPRNAIGVLPFFAANNVLKAVAHNDALFAVHVAGGSSPDGDDRGGNFSHLRLSTYIPRASASSAPRWTVPLNSFGSDRYGALQQVSVFILQSLYVCVASGPLQCYGVDGGPTQSYYLDEKIASHFGQPATDPTGTMAFVSPQHRPHAVRLATSDSTSVAPRLDYVWFGLVWPGHDEGVEMNVDQNTCESPQITNEGLVMSCGPQSDSRAPSKNRKLQRQIVVAAVTTGTVLLADGPWANPRSVIVSDNGIQISFVDDRRATAVSIQFAARMHLAPLRLKGSLCRQEGDAVFALYVDYSHFTAKRTPRNASQPAIELHYSDETAYAYEWMGFEGLRLGRTFVVVDSSGRLMTALYGALPTAVIVEKQLNFIAAGDSLSVTTDAFDSNLMDASMCESCAVGCPHVCTVDLESGDQYRYDFTPIFQWRAMKPNGTTIFLPNSSTPTFSTFSGNVSLDLLRTVAMLAPQQEVIPCVNGTTHEGDEDEETQRRRALTLLAPTNRYCLMRPRLSLKRWVVVRVSAGRYATAATYSAPWSDLEGGFSAVGHPHLDPPTVAGGWTAISTMLGSAIEAGAFPDDLDGGSGSGEGGQRTGGPSSAVFAVIVGDDDDGDGSGGGGVLGSVRDDGETANVTSVMSIYMSPDLSEPPIVLTNASCLTMDADIPECPGNILYLTDEDAAEQVNWEMQSVTWRGSLLSNWGDGFVAVNFRTRLSEIMRTPLRGLPQHCGASTACPVGCHPSDVCGSQVNNYFNEVFYAASYLPPGSTVPFPSTLLASCKGEEETRQRVKFAHSMTNFSSTMSVTNRRSPFSPTFSAANAPFSGLTGGFRGNRRFGGAVAGTEVGAPGDLDVRFVCLKNGKVAVITDSSTFIPEDNVIAALFSTSTPSALVGATFECTRCTYFLLRGVVAEPFGWLAGGAVKNLIVCILFYLMMEKVKSRQRLLSENRRRHKRHEKQIRMIDQRLRAIALHERRLQRRNQQQQQRGQQRGEASVACQLGNDDAAATTSVRFGGDAGAISFAYVPRPSGGVDAAERSTFGLQTVGEDTLSAGAARVSTAREEVSTRNAVEGRQADASKESAAPEESAAASILSPLLRLPLTFREPVARLSESERLVEKDELRKELDRSRVAVSKIREERRVIQQGRWWCSRKLPNPIALYASIISALGRFRRREDRRLQANSVKDNLVYKEFSADSLVEMLSAILGETAGNRRDVVSFAHFYQWNLCDNRQWVVREHVYEQSRFASPEVLEGLERELWAVQQRLQDVYILHKLAFKQHGDGQDSSSGDASGSGGLPFELLSSSSSSGATGSGGAGFLAASSQAMFSTSSEAGSSTQKRARWLAENADGRTASYRTTDTNNNRSAASFDVVSSVSGVRSPTNNDDSSLPHSTRDSTSSRRRDKHRHDHLLSSASGVRGGVLRLFGSRRRRRPFNASASSPFLLSSVRNSDVRDVSSFATLRTSMRTRRGAASEAGKATMLSSPASDASYSSFEDWEEGDGIEEDIGDEVERAAKKSAAFVGGDFPSFEGMASSQRRAPCKRSVVRQLRRQRLGRVESRFRKRHQQEGEHSVQREYERVSQQHFGRFGAEVDEAGVEEPFLPHWAGASQGDFALNGGSSATRGSMSAPPLGPAKHLVASATNFLRGEPAAAAATPPLNSAETHLLLRQSAQRTIAENLTRNVKFEGMDAYASAAASSPLSSLRHMVRHHQDANAGGNPSSPPRCPPADAEREKEEIAGGGATAVVTIGDDTSKPLLPTTTATAVHPSEAEGGEGRQTRDSDVESSDLVERAMALRELHRATENFNLFHEFKPHCFEYAALPSRKIDDKLLPSPLLIIFSLLETLITISIYSWDVFTRTYGGRDGTIRAFDLYQCVFFMIFNSSLPSSLVVNVIARADLGKTTHTKNALEKVRDIYTNPYFIITAVIFAVPMVTHVIPGFVVFIWLMAPALALSCVLEFYLRTRITVHSHGVVMARLGARIIVLFVASVVMSLSYNYSTAYIWGEDGYLATGSFGRDSYWEIVVSDFNSRSFSCTWGNIVYAVSNFVQMGFFFL